MTRYGDARIAAEDVRSARLAEMVAHLTGEDDRDSVEATASLFARPDVEPLQVVARAMLDLGQSGRALRITRYLDHSFEPVIDLRDGSGDIADADTRFSRRARATSTVSRRDGDRPAGTNSSGFVPA